MMLGMPTTILSAFSTYRESCMSRIIQNASYREFEIPRYLVVQVATTPDIL